MQKKMKHEGKEMEIKMDRKTEKIMEESEQFLIGIGEEFAPHVPAWDGPKCLEPFYISQYYAQLPDEHEVLQAYRKLREQIGERPYFVVTLNTDDLIFRAGFEPEQVVAPCGSNGKLQCSEHIVEAEKIAQCVMKAYQDEIEQKPEILKCRMEGMEQKGQEILKKYASCPVCGKALEAHTIKNDGYLENGYLPQWESYKKWLATTLNKKLCVMELGVGFQYPQVIRFPFERTVFYNKKAMFVRVHSKFPQIEAELADKAVTVKKSPVEWLLTEETDDLDR